MIGTTTSVRVGITGLGTYVPERVVTNAEIAAMVDTTDEWIVSRTGIRERRVARPDQAVSDISLPAAREALERAGATAGEIDLLIVSTVTPDHTLPASAAVLAHSLGATSAAAYDLSAGCTGFVYALAQAYGALATGLARKALVVGADTLSKITDWTDRGTCIVFGDGAGAAVVERVAEGGFLGFELGADGAGGPDLAVRAGGSREPATHETVDARRHYVHMNGGEVFRFATRVMVSSARELLEECGLGIDDVDLYVPHQANIRIIDHAVAKLGVPREKVVVNVDRYGNTSCGSIPLALGEALEQGRVTRGDRVLMTGMGAGLTWGSAVIEWTY